MIDVIIPTLWRQNPEEFRTLLEDLQDQPLIDEIIIVINDGTSYPEIDRREFLPKNKDKIHFVNRGGPNLGVNESWNLGARASCWSQVVWLLNDDLTLSGVDKGASLAAILGQAIYFLKDRPGNVDIVGRVGLIGTDVLNVDRTSGTAEGIHYTDVTDEKWCYGFGCSMFILKNMLRHYPIPSSFKIMCGDSYLCLRIKSLGMRVMQLSGMKFGGKMSTTTSPPEFAKIIEEDIENFHMWREGMGL